MSVRMFIQRRPHIPNPRWLGSHSAFSQSAAPALRQSAASRLLCTRSSTVRESRCRPKDLVDRAQSRQRNDIANDDGALTLDGAFRFQHGERGVYLGTAGANQQSQLAL